MERISTSVKYIYDRFTDIQKLVHASLEIAENIVCNLEHKLAKDNATLERYNFYCNLMLM
jgi:hypothetical protein